MKYNKTIIAIVAIILINLSKTLAQNEQPIAPPWMAHTSHLLYVLYSIDENNVTPFLPEGVTVKTNDQGKATVGLEFYEVDRSFGQGQGLISFIFVEIEGFGSSSGIPGHFPIWGVLQNQVALTAWQDFFGFPYELEVNMWQTKNGNIFNGGIGTKGAELISYSGKPVEGDFNKMQSDVNMIGKNKRGNYAKSQVPYLNSGRVFEVDKFEINPQGNPIWEMLKAETPFLYYLVEDAYFSYSALAE